MQKLLKKNTCQGSSKIYLTKLLVLTIITILLFSTIASSANATTFETKKEENIEDTNSSEDQDNSGLLNGGFKDTRLGQRLSSAKEKIKDFFNRNKNDDNESDSSFRLLDGSRDHRLLGFLDDLLTFHTNYSGVETSTGLGLFQTVKVDVDGTGGDDVSARVMVLPGFDFKTLSFTINFNLNIELLSGNSINQNAYLRAYAQLNFPGFLIKNLTDQNVKFGYISENKEKIPSSCTVTYKLAPNLLNPAKKPGHSFQINPGSNDDDKLSLFCDALGWSFYATYDSYVKSTIKIQDPIGPYDREFSINTDEKTNVKFHHERISKNGKPVNVGFYIEDLPKNVEFAWKTKISILPGEKIELGYKKTSSQNVNILFYKELFNERKFNYFFVKYLPSEVSFIFSSFMLKGYLELNTGGESISQIGLYDDLFKPKIGVYLSDLPSTNRIDFQFRIGLLRETEISFYSDTEGLSLNAFGSEISILDSESSFELQIKSQSNLDITIYFNLLKGRFEIDNKDPIELEAYFNFESDFLYASGNGHIESSNEPFVLDLNGFVNGIIVDDIDLGLGFEIKNGGGFTLHNLDIELDDAPVYIMDSGNMIPGHSMMDMEFSIENLIFERTTSSSREGIISFMPIFPLRDLGLDELLDSVIVKTYVSKECSLTVDSLDFDLDLTEIAVPNVNITAPTEGTVVENTITIQGTSSPGQKGHSVDYVEVKIGQNPWKKASKIGTSWDNWMIEWDTTNYPGGNYVIKARSYDGLYYSPLDSVTLKINGTGGSDDDDDDEIIDKPTISINPVIPPVSGVVTISGSTTPGESGRPVELVQIQIADEPWMNLSGTTSWSYNWDSSSKPIGRVIVKARCYDGVNYSDNASITLIVKNVDIIENSIIFEIEKEKSTYVNISNLNINYKKTFLQKNDNSPDPMEVKFSWKSLEITSSTSPSKFSFVLDKNDHSVSTSRSGTGSKIVLKDVHFEITNLNLSSVLPALKNVDSRIHVDRIVWDNTAATNSGFYLEINPFLDDNNGSLSVSGKIELSSHLELFGFYFIFNNLSYAKPELHLVGFTEFTFELNVTIRNVTWEIAPDMSWGWINISGEGYISVDLNIKKEGSDELLFELSGVFYLQGENEGLVFSWETLDETKYFTIDGDASIIVDNLKLHIRDVIKISNLSFEGKFEANLQQINSGGGKIWAGEVLAFLNLDGDGKGSIDFDFDIEKIGNLIPSMTIKGLLNVDLDYGFNVDGGLLGVKVKFNETGAPSFEIVDGAGNADLDLSGYISLKDFLFNYPDKNIFVTWSNIEINGDIHPTIFLTKNKVKLRLDAETEDITIIKIEKLVGSIPNFSGSLGYCSLSVGAAGFIEFLFDKNENNVLTIDAQAILDFGIEDVSLVTPGLAASCKEIDLPIEASATGSIVFGEEFQIEGFSGAIGVSGRIHIVGLSIKSPQISVYLSALYIYGNLNIAGEDQVIQVSGYAGGYLHISGGGLISTPAFGTLYVGGTLQLSGAISGSATLGIGNDNGGFSVNSVSGYLSGAVLADVSMTKGLTLFTEEQIDTFCSNTLNTIGNYINNITDSYDLSSFINSVINLIETGFVEPNSKDIIVTASLDIGVQGFIYFTYTPGSLYVAGNLNGGATVKITGLELTFYDRWNIAALQEITLQGSLNFAASTSSKYLEIGIDGEVLGVDLIEFNDLQTNTKIDVDLGVAQFEDNSIRMEWTGALKNLKPDSLKFIFGGGQFTLGYIKINVNNEEVFYMDVGTISISGSIDIDEISYSDSKIDGFHFISNLDASVGIMEITIQDVFSFSLSLNGQLVGDLGAYWEKDDEGTLDSVTVTSNSGLNLEINIEIELNGNHVYLSIPSISAGDFTIEWKKGSTLSIHSQSGFQGSIIQLKVNNDVIFSAFDFGISPNSDITIEWDYMDGNAKCVKATTSAGFDGYLSTIQLNSQTILDLNVEMSSGSSLEYRDWHTFHEGLDWSKDFYFDGSITVTVCRITLNGEVVDISGTLTGYNARIARGGLDSDSNLIYLIQSSDSISTVSGFSFSAQNVDIAGSVDWNGDLRSYFDMIWHDGQGTGKSFYFQSNNGFDGTTTLDVGNFHMIGSRTLGSGDCSIAFDLDGGSSDIKQFYMDTTPNSFIQHISFEFWYGANDAIKILDVGNIWANGKWIHWDFIRIPPYFDHGGEIGSGEEQPVIEATNDGGASWDQIWPYGNQKPNADIGGPYSADVGETVTFDASNSSDPDGDVLQYRWDFDYTGPLDVFWDTGWLDSPTVDHIYDTEGTYTLKLQVREKDTILHKKDNDSTTVNVAVLSEFNIELIYDGVDQGEDLFEGDDFEIYVTDSFSGDPVEDAFVTYQSYDDGVLIGEDTGYTDSSGSVYFVAHEVSDDNPFHENDCLVTVEKSGYVDDEIYFIVEKAVGRVRGYVKEHGSQDPIGDVLVVATNQDTSEEFSTYTSDGTGGHLVGFYDLYLPAGTYDIEASKTGYANGNLYDISVENGDNTLLDTIYLVSAPTVSTLNPGNIEQTTAYLRGNLGSMGGDNSCEVWFEYGLTENYGSSTDPVTVYSTGNFYKQIMGLTKCTAYHYRACASNNAGTSHGNDFSFNTDADPPVIDSVSHTSVTDSSAYLTGKLLDDGGEASTCWLILEQESCFVAGTLISMADGSLKSIEDIQVGDSVKSYDESSGSMVDSVVGHVFVHDAVEMGDYYLVINNRLRVTPDHPLFVNGDWVDADSVVVGDSLLDVSGESIEVLSVDRVFEPVVTYNLEVEGTHTYFADGVLVHNKPGPIQYNCGDHYDPYTFSHTFYNLQPSTPYKWTASADNSGGSSNTDWMYFTTDSDLDKPTLSTQNAASVTQNSAFLRGYLSDMGGANSCNVWFEYGLTTSYGYSTSPISVSSTGYFNTQVTGLSKCTTYHFRAWASNDAGSNHGNDEDFTTDSDKPVIDSVSHTSVTDSSAYLTGKLLDDGGEASTCWLILEQESCFVAGTLISMADGSLKSIEDIQVGDSVKSYDESSGSMVDSVVGHVFVHDAVEMGDYYLVINNRLRVTPDHPLFVNGDWVDADSVVVGDSLLDVSGESIEVLSVDRVFEPVVTYNLEVEGTHTYFADGVLVHNKPGPIQYNCGDHYDPYTFSHTFYNLQPSTPYKWTASADNSGGSSNTDWMYFTTDSDGSPPYFTTDIDTKTVSEQLAISLFNVDAYDADGDSLYFRVKYQYTYYNLDSYYDVIEDDSQVTISAKQYDSNSVRFKVEPKVDSGDQDEYYDIIVHVTDEQGDWYDDYEDFTIHISDDGTCLLSGSKITMAGNAKKNIEDVKIGDMVKSYDDKTGEITTSVVTSIHHHPKEEMTDYYMIINNILKITPNHRIYVNEEWTPAGKVKIDDYLQDIEGEKQRIFSIERIYEKVPTYNFEVNTTHSYYAEELLVHNGGTK